MAWPLLWASSGLWLIPTLLQWRDLRSALDLLGTILLLVAVLHTLRTLLDSRSWLSLLRALELSRLPSTRYLARAALIREAIGNCTSLSKTEAFAAAVRLLTLRGVESANATAIVVVESSLTLFTQIALIFAAILAWLFAMSPSILGGDPFDVLVAIALLSVAADLLLQRNWLSPDLFVSLLRRLSGVPRNGSKPAALNPVHLALNRLYEKPGACMVAATWQLAALAAGVAEFWVVLTLLHVSRPLLLALSLSGVVRIARSLAIGVPAGLGVQELAFGGLMAGAGQDFNLGLGISLATRVRDLLLGAPVLFGWPRLERSGRSQPADPAESPIEDIPT